MNGAWRPWQPAQSPAPAGVGRLPERDWPPAFDAQIYRRSHRDLRVMGERQLIEHYERHGRHEGRVCSAVNGREAMLACIGADARVLEIGPFFSPTFTRPSRDVAYVDAFDSAQLRARAATFEGGRPEAVPDIDYVWTDGPLSELILERFDVVFSSHNIEHQPCLISHLQDLSALLKPGGQVVMFVPDRRYCFDHFLPESTFPDVLGAWMEPRLRRQARNIVKQWFFVTHNDSDRHWQGDHGPDPALTLDAQLGERVTALRELYRVTSDYFDVHAWQFTPESFETLVRGLRTMELTSLEPYRVYPTLSGTNEFLAVLR
jgi:SAM-dependent methyltransferase